MTSANQYKCSLCGGVLELSLEAAQAHTDAVDAADGKPVSITSYFTCSKCGRPRTAMTAPHQRTRALLKTIHFLESLADLSVEPPVPEGVRFVAMDLLKDYPTLAEIELIHQALSALFHSVIQRQPESMPARRPGSLQEGEAALAADAGAVMVRALRNLVAKISQDAVVVLRYDYKDPDGSTTCEGLALGQVQAVKVRRLRSKDSWCDPRAGVQLYRLCEEGEPELLDANNGVFLG
jgi:hypothetical protein